MIGLVIGIAVAAGALVLLRDWRSAVPLLFGFDLLRIGVLWQVMPLAEGRETVLLAELTTAIGVTAILLVTASRLRYTSQLRATILHTALLLAAVVLVGAVTVVAVRALPITGDRNVAAACLFGVLCSLLVLLTARDVLKLGVGLLLLAGSIKLLYFAMSPGLLIVHVALWEALTIGLALLTAAFCDRLYGRLFTLEFGRLPDSEP